MLNLPGCYLLARSFVTVACEYSTLLTPHRYRNLPSGEKQGEMAAVFTGYCHCYHTVLLKGDGRLPRDYSILQNVSNEGKYKGMFNWNTH